MAQCQFCEKKLPVKKGNISTLLQHAQKQHTPELADLNKEEKRSQPMLIQVVQSRECYAMNSARKRERCCSDVDDWKRPGTNVHC